MSKHLQVYTPGAMYRVLEELSVNGQLDSPDSLHKPLYERDAFSLPKRVVLPQPNHEPAAFGRPDESLPLATATRSQQNSGWVSPSQ